MATIAILGASSDRNKFGNRCVRTYLQKGYTVYPIHPRETTIEGLAAYASIQDVPQESIDIVSIYLQPEIALRVLPEIAKKKVSQVWFNPGVDTSEVIEAAQSLGLNALVGCSILAVGGNPHI